jgi:hypothetical protein
VTVDVSVVVVLLVTDIVAVEVVSVVETLPETGTAGVVLVLET